MSMGISQCARECPSGIDSESVAELEYKAGEDAACAWKCQSAGRGLSLALIGRRASVGGSAALADWPCALSAVNSPPDGI